jgi:hypothetical protein
LHSKKFIACWWVPCSVLSQQAHPVVIVHWLIIKPDALVGLPHCHSVHTTFSLLSVTHVQSAQLHYILRERERERERERTLLDFDTQFLYLREKSKRKLSAFQYPILVLERKTQEKTLCILVPNFCTWEKNAREKSLHFCNPMFLYLRERKHKKTLYILEPTFCTQEKNTRETFLYFGTHLLYLRGKRTWWVLLE